jgi:ABC-type transport system substrate-binding protein
MNPEFDAAVLKFFSTIDHGTRMDLLRPIIHQASDELIVMGLFYDTTVTAVNNRIRGVTAANEGWNATDWSI